MKLIWNEPFKTRAPGQYDPNTASDTTGLKCEDPSLTTQDEAAECDINTLIARFHLDYTMPQMGKLPINADYVGQLTFQDAQNAIREATETFNSLHVDIRKRFAHDPAEFVNFCSNPDNLPELRKMKLAPELTPEPKAPDPITVRIKSEPEKETGKPVT